MTIEIWVKLEDLELLKKAHTAFPEKNLSVEYTVERHYKTQHCVHIQYDDFVWLTDTDILKKC